MFRKCRLSIVAVCMLGLSQPLPAEPLTSMNEVSVALRRCWSKTAFAQHDASVTLRFSFKRDGTLLGQPQPSAIVFRGSPDQRLAFVNAAIKAVNVCVPLDFSPKIAAAFPAAFSRWSSGPTGHVSTNAATKSPCCRDCLFLCLGLRHHFRHCPWSSRT